MMVQSKSWMVDNPGRVQLSWTRTEDKLFEQALVEIPDGIPDRWERIAGHLPGKSPEDVKAHYDALVYDVIEIDSGRVELPTYSDDSRDTETKENQISFGSTAKSRHSDVGERKKGNPWTEDEHKLFLAGLERYGKGDWRSISRNVVVTRTPTQVASHAQKYYLRQSSSTKKERKRSSIHDITDATSSLPLPATTQFPNQGATHFPNQGATHFPNQGATHFPNQGAIMGYHNDFSNHPMH